MAIPPDIRFHQFNTNNITPSGERHLTSASGFVKELGVGADEFLDFGSKNISLGKQTSITAAIVAFASGFNDANEAIFNLRFYLTDVSGFTQGNVFFNGFASGQWIQNINLTDASGLFVPTVLPSGQNLFRQDGGTEITGVNSDDQVTQFYYLSITCDTDVPPNSYGGDAGGFTYRLTYDFR